MQAVQQVKFRTNAYAQAISQVKISNRAVAEQIQSQTKNLSTQIEQKVEKQCQDFQNIILTYKSNKDNLELQLESKDRIIAQLQNEVQMYDKSLNQLDEDNTNKQVRINRLKELIQTYKLASDQKNKVQLEENQKLIQKKQLLEDHIGIFESQIEKYKHYFQFELQVKEDPPELIIAFKGINQLDKEKIYQVRLALMKGGRVESQSQVQYRIVQIQPELSNLELEIGKLEQKLQKDGNLKYFVWHTRKLLEQYVQKNAELVNATS